MICALMLLTGMTLGSFGQGVNFEECSFDQALEKAKAEGKLVFVDCYTSWCGPCKRMTKDVFPQEIVGEYMNDKFVNLKIDMEKGEGVELAKRFRVASYPTFLVVNPDGTLVHKFLGMTGPKTFLERLKESFDPEKSFGALDKRYEDGERDKAFLTEYVNFLRSCSDSKMYEVMDELFSCLTREERLSEDYRFFFQRVDFFPVGSEAWKFFVDERDAFEQIMKPEEMNRLLYFNYQDLIFRMFDGRSELWPVRKLKWLEKELDRTPFEPDRMSLIRKYIHIAQALHKGMDEMLNVYEQECTDIPYNRFNGRSIYKRYESQMTEEQKARWEKIWEQQKELMSESERARINKVEARKKS